MTAGIRLGLLRRTLYKGFATLFVACVLRYTVERSKHTTHSRKLAYCAIGSLNTLAIEPELQESLRRFVLDPLKADLFIHGDSATDPAGLKKDIYDVAIDGTDVESMARTLKPKIVTLERIERPSWDARAHSFECVENAHFKNKSYAFVPLIEHAKGCVRSIVEVEQREKVVYSWVAFARTEVMYQASASPALLTALESSPALSVLASTSLSERYLNGRLLILRRHNVEQYTEYISFLQRIPCNATVDTSNCPPNKSGTEECLFTWYHSLRSAGDIHMINGMLPHFLKRRCGSKAQCRRLAAKLCVQNYTFATPIYYGRFLQNISDLARLCDAMKQYFYI